MRLPYMTMIAALIALPSCASQTSIKVDPKPVVELRQQAAQPDASLREPCADPVDLRGYQGLNAGPVERLWFIDRFSLSVCRDKKAALQRFYDERDAALAGAN